MLTLDVEEEKCPIGTATPTVFVTDATALLCE